MKGYADLAHLPEDKRIEIIAYRTAALPLCETYARDPKFYGATFCVACCGHFPVGEFRWIESDGSLGPIVGT
jgi:hypothetical protein